MNEQVLAIVCSYIAGVALVGVLGKKDTIDIFIELIHPIALGLILLARLWK